MMRAALLLGVLVASPTAGQTVLGTWACVMEDELSRGTMTVTYGRAGAYSADFVFDLASRRFGTAYFEGSTRGRYAVEAADQQTATLVETPEIVTLSGAAWMGVDVDNPQDVADLVEDMWQPAQILFVSEDEFVRIADMPLRGVCTRAE